MEEWKNLTESDEGGPVRVKPGKAR